MLVPLFDRTFWIYFIILVFFLVIGLATVSWSSYSVFILVTTSLLLLVVTFYLSSIPRTKDWLVIQVVFFLLLVLTMIWIGDARGKMLRASCGILILLAGTILLDATSLKCPAPAFWWMTAYLLVWLAVVIHDIFIL